MMGRAKMERMLAIRRSRRRIAKQGFGFGKDIFGAFEIELNKVLKEDIMVGWKETAKSDQEWISLFHKGGS